jgi:cytochrome P450
MRRMSDRFPPGPRGLPLLGHLPWLLSDAPRFLTQAARTYGDVVSIRVGRNRAVLINDPTLIDRVVRDRTMFRTEPTRRAMASFLGYGLLSLEAAPHMRHRRLMQPAFHKQRIARYGEIMARETERALAEFRSGQRRDMRADMTALTLAIVSKSLFNTDARDDAREVGEALERIMPWVVRGARLAGILPPDRPLPYPKATREAIATLQRLVQKLVAERRAAGEDRGDLLSMLLATRDEDGSALSEEEVCAEALTILLAGHETTALALSWAWYLLTKHPEQQELLAAEVTRELGGRPVTADDLPRLPYALQVVRETLRLYPTAWIGDRVAAEEMELGGYRIPRNTGVIFSVFVTHRDARFFPDPERFDPQRFTPERMAQMPNGAYLPFGAGVHTCIGNAFALMEAQLILASMAARFRFTAVPNQRIRLKPVVTLSMSGSFEVEVEARTRPAQSEGAIPQAASGA